MKSFESDFRTNLGLTVLYYEVISQQPFYCFKLESFEIIVQADLQFSSNKPMDRQTVPKQLPIYELYFPRECLMKRSVCLNV